MRKKMISILMIAMLCVGCYGCVNKNVADISADNIETEIALIDRKGDTSVPKTAEEIVSDSGILEHDTLAIAEKTFGDSFSIPEINNYPSVQYVTTDDTIRAVCSNNEGLAVSIYKGRNSINLDTSDYDFLYETKCGNLDISAGSRLGIEFAGYISWENSGYFYVIETSAWDELPIEELTQIVLAVS